MLLGNLVELEDLEGLLSILSEAQGLLNLNDKKMRDEIAYTEMVVRHVNPGSGIVDVIENSEKDFIFYG